MIESNQPEHYVDPDLDLDELKKEGNENEFRRSDTDDYDDENERVQQVLNPNFSSHEES